jgi:hypothetical protein
MEQPQPILELMQCSPRHGLDEHGDYVFGGKGEIRTHGTPRCTLDFEYCSEYRVEP